MNLCIRGTASTGVRKDLATPDYQQPMKDDLLWVYEGLTEYLGSVLTARSGLLTKDQGMDELAALVATYENRPGRDWRPLQDTADAAPFLYNATEDWSNWRRGTDFYEEGELLWLDVDETLRGLTKDQKSMNDFCRIFHGGPGGAPALKTYTFEDVVATLNSLAPYDWAGFLRARLDGTSTKNADRSCRKRRMEIGVQRRVQCDGRNREHVGETPEFDVCRGDGYFR